METLPSPSNQEGPTKMPPVLPDGWLAQIDQEGRYYYVQRVTGHTQWSVPTQPAPSAPSPYPTPQQVTDPYVKPDGNAAVALGPDGSEQTEADRGLLSNLALNAITGGKIKPQNQSGLGGLASSFLGGQSSHGGGSSSGGGGGGGIGGPIGHLVGSLFADKPNNQDQQSHPSQPSSGYGGSASAGGHQGGGMMGFFGGHHGSSNNNFGYSSAGQGSSGGYSEQAPPATYKPPGKQSSSQYGSLSGVNHIQAQQSQYDSHPAGSSSVQYGTHPQQRPQGYAQGGVNTTGASQYGPMTSGSSQYGQTTSHSTTSLPLYGHNNLSNQSVYSQDNASFPGPPGEHHGHHHKPPQDSYGQQQNQVFPGPPNGPQNNSQNDYPGQQNNSYANQPPSTHTPSHPSPLAYGQQNGSSYAPQPQSTPYGRPPPPPQSAPYGQQQPPPYNPYPQSQTSFQPPLQGTPAYTAQNNPPYNPQTAQHNQASFNVNASAPPPVPPMSSHPSQQGSGPGPGPGPNQGLTPGQHPYPPRPNSSQSGTYPGQVPYPPRPTSGTGPSPAPGYTQPQFPPQPPPKDDFPIPVNHPPHPQQPAYGQPYGAGHPQAHLPHDGYLTGGLVFGQGGGAPPPPPSWRA